MTRVQSTQEEIAMCQISIASLATAIAACLAGSVIGCAGDTDIADASELHQRCSNPGAIIFRYTDGNPYVTADVQVDGKPVDATAEISWTLLDGTVGRRQASLAMAAGPEVGPGTLMIPLAGKGTYTVDVQDVVDGCEPFRKSLVFLESIEAPEARRSDSFTAGCSAGQFINGSSNGDVLNGGPDNDTLNGNEGGDELHGNDCDDVLNGGKGNDKLFGGDGDDVLDGGSDTIFGGDCCVGGPGTDQFLNCEQIGPPC
jgi:hypothetical protein